MQSFLGKINFVRRFVPNFAQIVRPFQDMIKKDVVFKWSDVQKDTFKNIKKSIMEAPTLMPPDFLKYFILYTLLLIFLMSPCLCIKWRRCGDPGVFHELDIQRSWIKLYIGRQTSLYCLQVCETFKVLSIEVKGKGYSPIRIYKKSVDPKRVGREKSSLDDCAPGVWFGYKTCQNGKRAGFILIGSQIQCSEVGIAMCSWVINVS